MSWRERQRGQGLVEFTMVVPLMLTVVLAVAELGLAFGDLHTVGYASREGSRVGSALASGGVIDCSGGSDPSSVDVAVVSAVQRILKGPGSGLNPAQVEEVRIFRATSTGAETPGLVNVWEYTGPFSGPLSAPGEARLDFSLVSLNAWPACSRDNSASPPDSIGVTVKYRYEMSTPLPAVINAISGGTMAIALNETTVMALNPSL